MQRKAQSGANAATLIAIIMGLIILYILFLPPAERDKLLNPDSGTKTGTATGNKTVAALLLEHPGTLFKTEQKDIEHRVDSFSIFTRTEDKLLKSFDTINIESTRSGTNSRKFVFNVDDPENTKNALMTFEAVDRSGRLNIKLNGDVVLNEEVKGQRILNLEDLKSTNEMEFSVSEVPFWQFWSKNFYDIHSVKIIATISDITNKDATKTFFVTNNEAPNIESATLTYFVDCATSDNGKLNVYINGIRLSSGIPDCNSIAKNSINPNNIAAGNNDLRFSTEKGTFLLDRVVVKTHLREAIRPIYYFEVNKTTKQDITAGVKAAVLRLKFVDDKEEKLGIINVNGHRISFDTKLRPEYEKDISLNIEEGNNYIQLEPEVTLNVVDLKVELVKK